MKNGKQEISSGLVDDEDDDIGVVDDDVLVALNFEALRKVGGCSLLSICSFHRFSAHFTLPGSLILDECICTCYKSPKYSP